MNFWDKVTTRMFFGQDDAYDVNQMLRLNAGMFVVPCARGSCDEHRWGADLLKKHAFS
jgi:hypothetical protein